MLLYALIYALWALKAKVSPQQADAGHVFTGFSLRKPVKNLFTFKVINANMTKALFLWRASSAWQKSKENVKEATCYMPRTETRVNCFETYLRKKFNKVSVWWSVYIYCPRQSQCRYCRPIVFYTFEIYSSLTKQYAFCFIAVVSYKSDNVSLKWELPPCSHPPAITPLF